MDNDPAERRRERRNVYATLTLAIQASVAVGIVRFVLMREWSNVFLTALVIGLTLAPALLRRRYRVDVPPEFQLVSAAFVFLSPLLGSARGFYYRVWWWDMALHTGSGYLLGIVGFLALFLLNRTDRIPRGLSPAFVGFFGVTFAVTLGVLWEVFEYAVDTVAPHVNMQSRETGVADTMHDLIVSTAGAAAVGLMGSAYLRGGRCSCVAHTVRKFVRRNPGCSGPRAAENLEPVSRACDDDRGAGELGKAVRGRRKSRPRAATRRQGFDPRPERLDRSPRRGGPSAALSADIGGPFRRTIAATAAASVRHPFRNLVQADNAGTRY